MTRLDWEAANQKQSSPAPTPKIRSSQPKTASVLKRNSRARGQARAHTRVRSWRGRGRP
jgi:hypothetical protein